MKNILKKILLVTIIMLLPCIIVNAHGGNITGWKNKDSKDIIINDGKFYGHHNQDKVKHYHEVKWNEDKQRWDIINPAVYYNENFNIINKKNEEKENRIKVEFYKKVDGDTAKFKLGKDIIVVRFLGINTPETVDRSKEEEPFGREASNFTEEKLKNAKKIEIEYDECAQKKDKYGRSLSWIWVDDNLLQEEIVKNGLAKTYMLQNNYKYAGNLQLAEEQAKENKIGIWSDEKQVKEVTSENKIEEEKDNNINKTTSNDNKSNIIMEVVILILVIISSIFSTKFFKKKKVRKRRR